jgi:hypothetical protein
LLNGLSGFQSALWGALVLSLLNAAFRLWNKKSPLYAFSGVVGVGLAVGIALYLGRSEGFFVTDLISGSMMLFLAILSLVIRHPMAAWTSFLARRWPIDWYWHAQARPAHSEVTFAWAIFFFRTVIYAIFPVPAGEHGHAGGSEAHDQLARDHLDLDSQLCKWNLVTRKPARSKR